MAHPPRDQVPARTLQRVRKLCLALPETSEKLAWGHPTFRVRDKIFATIGAYQEDDPAPGRRAGAYKVTMTTKPPPGEQDALLAEGAPFFFPSYVGVRGWIGFVVDSKTDWKLVAELVEDSYREIAPKRLVALLD
jgi:predicted DNA-binding protein (MmcQ/YjbR family)